MVPPYLAEERLPGKTIAETAPLIAPLTSVYVELPGLIDLATYVVLVWQGAPTDKKALRQVIHTPAR